MLGAKSPFSSWTGTLRAPRIVATGAWRCGARLIDFDDEGSSRRCVKNQEGSHASTVSALRGSGRHKDVVVACVRCVSAPIHQEVRSFGTTTGALLELTEWLNSVGCTHVAMEATGVYWKPIWHILEEDFERVLGNARHIRNVPGRKTDVKDAEWIADLVRHGLIAKSFVPPAPLRELRELLRYRRKLVESQAAERNRLLKLLETANIKLASVASDVFGVSGRAMLRALIAGEASPEAMADLARGLLRRKRAD